MVILDVYGKKIFAGDNSVSIKLIWDKSKQFFLHPEIETLFVASNLVIKVDDTLYYASHLTIDSINFSEMTYIVEGCINLTALFTNRHWVTVSRLGREEKLELEKELDLIEKSKKYNVFSIEQYDEEFKINRALLFDYIVSTFYKNV